MWLVYRVVKIVHKLKRVLEAWPQVHNANSAVEYIEQKSKFCNVKTIFTTNFRTLKMWTTLQTASQISYSLNFTLQVITRQATLVWKLKNFSLYYKCDMCCFS